MTYFSWLHVTDLHRGMKEQHWLWPSIREIFFDDLKRLHEKCGPWDLVLFTGDLTQCGSTEEFLKVDELLAQLWECFETLGSSPRLLAVPGNHDLVRPERKKPEVKLLRQWESDQEIQEEFWEEAGSPYRQVVTRAFENYSTWWHKQPFTAKNVNPGILPGDFSVSIAKGDAKLGIVGLNTSFLQLTDDDYEGKLALHPLQFHGTCEGDGPAWVKKHHACLLLTHHPSAWLNATSQQDLKEHITAHGWFAWHLCGHNHETATHDMSEGGAEPRRLWLGKSLFGLEYFGQQQERLHGYVAGRLELHKEQQGNILFWPREARLQGGQRNIVPDQAVVLTDEQHTAPKEFDLLHPYTLPGGQGENIVPDDTTIHEQPEADRREKSSQKSGIHFGDVSGDVTIEAGGDIVAGDKIIQTQDIHYHNHIEPSARVDTAALEEAYLYQLLETCNQMSLQGIDRKAASREAAGLNLSAIYTALLTFGTEKKDKADSLMKHPDEQEHMRSALARLNDHHRLVLLGDPGSGKSTFVNFVALCLAGERLGDSQANLTLLTAPLPKDDGEDEDEPQPWDREAVLPICVILRDLAARSLPPAGQRATVNHFWKFLSHELKEARLQHYTAYLETHLREQGGLVLFDGLDEVPEAARRRTQIKQMVEDFARKFPRCRVVVTSRIYAYQQQDWRLNGFAEAVLAPFTPGQIRRFIDRWYTHSGELRRMNLENALGQAKILKQAIFQSKRLQKLAERPLLLTLMASLHYWRGGSLPEKREELYADAVELLLDWWESPKIVRDAQGEMMIAQESLSELLNAGKEPVRKALETLAFQAHMRQTELTGTADITEAELVQKLLEVSQNENLRPKQLVKYLSQRAGLLDARGVKVYTFPHRTFQEYLAACYLTNQNEYPDNVAELTRRDPNRWREVLLLAGAKAARGAASSVWGLADALCYRSPDDPNCSTEDAWGALLAGQNLVEIANLEQISPRNRKKVEGIRAWLIVIITERQPSDTPFPVVERALAGNILAHIGDPRSGVGLREDGLPDIEWCEVPAGSFMMGTDEYSNERPRHKVTLSAYRISRYPVTNAQYQAFVRDGGYTEKWQQCWTPEGWKWKAKQAINEPYMYGGVFDLPNHPVVVVSWYEVTTFCQWLTIRLRENGELADDQLVRLPTEAEWEKAARGADERVYPWGDEIDSNLANYDDTGLGATSAVGCFPGGASPYGCEDMAGNVWEWCADWYDSEYYSKSPLQDPQGPSSGEFRMLRGGSWYNYPVNCRVANRGLNYPDVRYNVVGFRVVLVSSWTLS